MYHVPAVQKIFAFCDDGDIIVHDTSSVSSRQHSTFCGCLFPEETLDQQSVCCWIL